MGEQAARRFKVVVEEGILHGDLYELEQTTYYYVVDRGSGNTTLTFEGRLEAGLSLNAGLWNGYCLSGVCEVCIAPDEQSVIVKYCDRHAETVSLPV